MPDRSMQCSKPVLRTLKVVPNSFVKESMESLKNRLLGPDNRLRPTWVVAKKNIPN